MKPKELLKLLDDLGWSKARLADAVGMSEAAVKMWCAGLRKPGGSAIVVLNQLRRRADRLAAKRPAAAPSPTLVPA